MSTKEPTFVLPGGNRVPVKQIVDHSYYAGRHTTICSPVADYLKNPNPDCEYAWVQCHNKDKTAEARVAGLFRGGVYRPVEESEMREDTDLEYYIDKNDLIVFRDVALVETPREHAQRMFRYKQQRSLQGLINTEGLKSEITANTDGAVTADVSMKVIRD